MLSIDTVSADREDELRQEALEELPGLLRSLRPTIELVNEVHWIARWVTISASGRSGSFELRRLDLGELASRYPDLDLGW
jgi:hypothetical protein